MRVYSYLLFHNQANYNSELQTVLQTQRFRHVVLGVPLDFEDQMSGLLMPGHKPRVMIMSSFLNHCRWSRPFLLLLLSTIPFLSCSLYSDYINKVKRTDLTSRDKFHEATRSPESATCSCPEPDQSSPCLGFYFLHVNINIILRFPHQNFSCISALPISATRHINMFPLDCIKQIVSGEECRSGHSSSTPSLIFISTIFSDTLILRDLRCSEMFRSVDW